MKSKKNRALVIMILALILAIFCVASMIIHKIASNDQIREARRAAEQDEQQKAEEEAAKQEKLEKIAEEKAQWYLILVNPWTEIEGGYVADARIKDALKEMLADCREAGYSPRIVSTFRTRETQQYLYDHTANKADTALPGHSEHECGLAADIIDVDSIGWSDPLIDAQEDMPAQKWLMEHCQDYGFILRYPKDKEEITGIVYEPWHYRYVGKEHAAIIMENGLCLEEYLRDMEKYY